ncbi:MAG: hypothetical protein L3K00_08015 [Thermoplasmata archaeon]|nr:hypothetical protein [Thermoplasmata archaeon]
MTDLAAVTPKVVRPQPDPETPPTLLVGMCNTVTSVSTVEAGAAGALMGYILLAPSDQLSEIERILRSLGTLTPVIEKSQTEQLFSDPSSTTQATPMLGFQDSNGSQPVQGFATDESRGPTGWMSPEDAELPPGVKGRYYVAGVIAKIREPRASRA